MNDSNAIVSKTYIDHLDSSIFLFDKYNKMDERVFLSKLRFQTSKNETSSITKMFFCDHNCIPQTVTKYVKEPITTTCRNYILTLLSRNCLHVVIVKGVRRSFTFIFYSDWVWFDQKLLFITRNKTNATTVRILHLSRLYSSHIATLCDNDRICDSKPKKDSI